MIEQYDLSADRVVLLAHPPAPSFLTALDHASSRIEAKRPTRKAALCLLCVARVDDPRKGVGELLHAVARARAADMPVELTVAGPYTERWRDAFSEAIRASEVRLLGKVDVGQLVEQYLSHDALVVPSRQEGFGIVVSEAFHAGLPVIATGCGGSEATILHSEGGLLVDRDVNAMVSTFHTLLESADLLPTMAANARRYASSELSISTFVQRVRTLTQHLVESRAPLPV